jgi:hypothetical protein
MGQPPGSAQWERVSELTFPHWGVASGEKSN